MNGLPTVSPLRAVARLLPRRADYAGLRDTWRADVIAGATVGVVALPLALAFGITTGLGAEAGLVTAIVAGIVAAVFGGSNVQVSGPTGAMTVVLVPVVARFGADAVLVVGIIAGFLVLAAAFLRLGRYLAFVPWPVVEGFTLGIAVIIFLQQVPLALGVPRPDGESTAAGGREGRGRRPRPRSERDGRPRAARGGHHGGAAPPAPQPARLADGGRGRHGRRRARLPRRAPHRLPSELTPPALTSLGVR